MQNDKTLKKQYGLIVVVFAEVLSRAAVRSQVPIQVEQFISS